MNLPENLFLNFHAHQQEPAEGEVVIQSKFLQEKLVTNNSDKKKITSGLHPWHADKLSVSEVSERLEKRIKNKKIIAIGETGLDKIKGPDFNSQLKILHVHIDIASQYKMPLIIHSVKSNNEIIKIKKDSKSTVPWVIHHFNGSKEMAFSLIEHGFYLSIGYHINKLSTKISSYFGELPIEKIFLETDDFDIDIKDLYKTASQKLNVDIELLKQQLIKNFNYLINEE